MRSAEPQPPFLNRQLDIAASVWAEISAARTPADRWLGSFFQHNRKKFGVKDRRLYAETIYAAFRHKTLLELWIAEGGVLPGDRNLAMAFLAASSEDLLTETDFWGFANQHGWKFTSAHFRAIKKHELPPSQEHLRSGDPVKLLSVLYSFPEWLIRRWIAFFGEEQCLQLLDVCARRPPFVIRVNPLKISRKELKGKLMTAGHQVRETAQSPYGLVFEERANLFGSPFFQEGLFEVQDEGSQLVGIKMAPAPGEWVWDACAGGGGKTLLLGALMQNKGRVVATDIRMSKLDELAKRAKRAGLHNVFPADLKRMAEMKHARRGFDKILVDAPCSGTGTLRRNPDAKWKLTEDDFARHQKDQLEILESVLPYLKEGGRIYYATCSLEPEENEQVMEKFMEKHPELSQVPIGETGPFLRFFPPRDQTDGFFLAVAENKKRA